MPKISVIIPVYNVEQYLSQCLESVVSQTLSDIEIVVVDDGSPDESSKIYQSYADKDSRIIIVKKENAGVSKARNTGLMHATGDWVIFIDSDDWMATDACEILYREAVNNDVDMVIADVYIHHEKSVNERVHVFSESFVSEDRKLIKQYKKSIIGYAYNPKPYKKCTMPTGLGGPWNKLVKRSILSENNILYDSYVNGIFDDCLFSLEVLEHVKKIAYVACPVYYYRMVATSLLHRYKANILDTNYRIFERIQKHIQKYERWEDFKGAFFFYVVRRLDESLGVYFFAKENPQSFRERLNSLKQLILSEPYRMALCEVDEKLLHKSRRMMCLMGRIKSAAGIFIVYKLKWWKLKHSANNTNGREE